MYNTNRLLKSSKVKPKNKIMILTARILLQNDQSYTFATLNFKKLRKENTLILKRKRAVKGSNMH